MPAFIVLAGILFYAVGAPQARAATTTISVNGTSAGRTFDGAGAISGGGGNSRLLYDYPAAEQKAILDYLFEPGYGADLQILKVEIGGDTNSTDGSESSIEHTQGVISCHAGYEFWLMEHLVSWLNCAKSDGLTINNLGGLNEKGHDVSWFEQLRSTLNADGYSSVQFVAADNYGTGGRDVANDIAGNSAFADAVSIIGVHYPCSRGDGGASTSCPSTSTAEETGKPLWASEGGSQDLSSGAPALIRQIIRGYTDGEMTGYINWPLIASVYPNLPYATDGLMEANQTWSGAYTVGEQLWAPGGWTRPPPARAHPVIALRSAVDSRTLAYNERAGEN